MYLIIILKLSLLSPTEIFLPELTLSDLVIYHYIVFNVFCCMLM